MKEGIKMSKETIEYLQGQQAEMDALVRYLDSLNTDFVSVKDMIDYCCVRRGLLINKSFSHIDEMARIALQEFAGDNHE